MIEPTPATVTTSDGVTLGATLYRPSEARAAVMIAPATGIRRRFYDRFARHLCEQGYGVITFENRGIGDSGAPAAKSAATLVDWGRRDMPAVLGRLQEEFPGVATTLVGHSAGGQLVGLMPNALDLSAIVAVACSSGSLRNMEPQYRLKAHFFLNVFLPLTSRVLGAGRSDWVGMGEPLPRNVARQWGEWCSGSGYVEVELARDPALADHLYDAVTMPSLWLYASDDDIANAANVADMIRVHTQLPHAVQEVRPADFGGAPIGHMGFFRRPDLWPLAVDWLRHQLPSR